MSLNSLSYTCTNNTEADNSFWWYYKWIIIQLDHKPGFDYEGMFIHIKVSLFVWKQGHSFAGHLDFCFFF